MSRPATGVRDRVWVKALVLHDGRLRRAVVTADVLALPRQGRAFVYGGKTTQVLDGDLKPLGEIAAGMGSLRVFVLEAPGAGPG